MGLKHQGRLMVNRVFDALKIPQISPRVPLCFIEVSNKCNLRCDFCPRSDLSRGTGLMEFDLFKLAVQRVNEIGARYVNFNRFGECLTHPRFLEMLRYAKKEGVRNMGFVSNGQLLTPEIAEEIVDIGVDRVNISLDTLDKEKYEKVRKGATLEKTLDNLDSLIDCRNRKGKNRPVIGLFSVLVNEEFEQMRQIFTRYVNRVNFVEFRPIANYGTSQRLEDLPHIKANPDKLFPCIQPWQRLNIFFNGDVNPCCGDVDCKLYLGNIKESSLKEIWHGAAISKIRHQMTKKEFDELQICWACDGKNKEWHDDALEQLREVYRKLDPDIEVVGLNASTPILFRRSTGKSWK